MAKKKGEMQKAARHGRMTEAEAVAEVLWARMNGGSSGRRYTLIARHPIAAISLSTSHAERVSMRKGHQLTQHRS